MPLSTPSFARDNLRVGNDQLQRTSGPYGGLSKPPTPGGAGAAGAAGGRPALQPPSVAPATPQGAGKIPLPSQPLKLWHQQEPGPAQPASYGSRPVGRMQDSVNLIKSRHGGQLPTSSTGLGPGDTPQRLGPLGSGYRTYGRGRFAVARPRDSVNPAPPVPQFENIDAMRRDYANLVNHGNQRVEAARTMRTGYMPAGMREQLAPYQSQSPATAGLTGEEERNQAIAGMQGANQTIQQIARLQREGSNPQLSRQIGQHVQSRLGNQYLPQLAGGHPQGLPAGELHPQDLPGGQPSSVAQATPSSAPAPLPKPQDIGEPSEWASRGPSQADPFQAGPRPPGTAFDPEMEALAKRHDAGAPMMLPSPQGARRFDYRPDPGIEALAKRHDAGAPAMLPPGYGPEPGDLPAESRDTQLETLARGQGWADERLGKLPQGFGPQPEDLPQASPMHDYLANVRWPSLGAFPQPDFDSPSVPQQSLFAPPGPGPDLTGAPEPMPEDFAFDESVEPNIAQTGFVPQQPLLSPPPMNTYLGPEYQPGMETQPVGPSLLDRRQLGQGMSELQKASAARQEVRQVIGEFAYGYLDEMLKRGVAFEEAIRRGECAGRVCEPVKEGLAQLVEKKAWVRERMEKEAVLPAIAGAAKAAPKAWQLLRSGFTHGGKLPWLSETVEQGLRPGRLATIRDKIGPAWGALSQGARQAEQATGHARALRPFGRQAWMHELGQPVRGWMMGTGAGMGIDAATGLAGYDTDATSKLGLIGAGLRLPFLGSQVTPRLLSGGRAARPLGKALHTGQIAASAKGMGSLWNPTRVGHLTSNVYRPAIQARNVLGTATLPLMLANAAGMPRNVPAAYTAAKQRAVADGLAQQFGFANGEDLKASLLGQFMTGMSQGGLGGGLSAAWKSLPSEQRSLLGLGGLGLLGGGLAAAGGSPLLGAAGVLGGGAAAGHALLNQPGSVNSLLASMSLPEAQQVFKGIGDISEQYGDRRLFDALPESQRSQMIKQLLSAVRGGPATELARASG